jgi:hypothetical protein
VLRPSALAPPPVAFPSRCFREDVCRVVLGIDALAKEVTRPLEVSEMEVIHTHPSVAMCELLESQPPSSEMKERIHTVLWLASAAAACFEALEFGLGRFVL